MAEESALGPLIAYRINMAAPDPAIDVGRSRLVEYALTRNADRLVFVAGQRPDEFVLQPIAARTLLFGVNTETNDHRRQLLAFSASCHEIRCGDGSIMRAEEHGAIQNGIAREGWLLAVMERFGSATLNEMGQVAHARASAPKGSPPRFEWPHG